ncbi:MAG: KEOPS complex N(6)-L-threonylcarbamoyladenine synthase Kae1 [Candidatus Korarchaeota archaeon]|nr:KEOPS complex N(6)-L-threonylcarbamoyladenine synthase Kae1 [Candidatus Korarchaeota archaeon]
MISLGIESTAHTFGVGIITSEGEILANVWDSYKSPEGGMRPHELAEHHFNTAVKVIKDALDQAGLTLSDISIIGYSRGPGIGQALLIGAFISRSLALKYGKPLVGVNHPLAHVEIGRKITKSYDPVVLYVSGGNTQVITHNGRRYVVLGETLDVGLGNAQDKLGREIGLPFPAGPKLDRMMGKWVELPYTVKGMDLSFSGLLTEALRRIKSGERVEDVVWSFMEVAFSMTIEVAERALALSGKDELLLVGGVAASPRLKEKAEVMCRERGVELKVPPVELVRDNGAMIAWTAILSYRIRGPEPIEESSIKPQWRIDEIEWPLTDI